MNKITILLPIYNGEKVMHFSLESITKQTSKAFNLLIIDDYSDDSSIKLIEENIHIKFDLIKNSKNLGLSKTILKAIKLVETEYVYILEQDDAIEYEFVNKVIDSLDKYDNPDIIAVNVKAVMNYDSLDKIRSEADDKSCNALIYNAITIGEFYRDINLLKGYYTNKVIKKNVLIKSLIKNDYIINDLSNMYMTIYYSKDLVYLTSVYHYKFKNPNSLSRNENKNIAYHLDFLKIIAEIILFVNANEKSSYRETMRFLLPIAISNLRIITKSVCNYNPYTYLKKNGFIKLNYLNYNRRLIKNSIWILIFFIYELFEDKGDKNL
jgi:glycosyltransferase involved in cell wall biosynthesis